MLAAQKGNLEITGLLCAQPDIQLQAKDNVCRFLMCMYMCFMINFFL